MLTALLVASANTACCTLVYAYDAQFNLPCVPFALNGHK